MSDSSAPGTETVKLRKGVQSLSQEIGFLTGVSGPIYQLVMEVRKSNELAVSNQRRMRFALGALFFCFIGIWYSLYLVKSTVREMSDLQEAQARSFEFAKLTDDKVMAAQKSIDEAPKIVANDDGSLKVVATVRVDSDYGADASAAKDEEHTAQKAERREKKVKSTMKMVDDVLAGLESPPSAKAAPKVVEIPIKMEAAELK